jgi:hydrogenase maturation factor
MAEVDTEGRRAWFNALAQPDVKTGDYVLTHANLIVAIISQAEAQQMLQAARELAEAEAAEQETRQERTPGASSETSGSEPENGSNQES